MTSLISKRTWLLIAGALAALMLVAACGGDDDDSGGESTRTATQAAGGDNGTPTSTDSSGGEEVTPTDSSGGSNGNGNQIDEGSDACALLTEDEVGQVLGASVPAGDPTDITPLFACTWVTDDFDSVDFELTDREYGESLFEFNSDAADDVDGLGDRAQYSGTFALLEVLDGDYYISVSVHRSGLADDEIRAGAISLAEKALGRLP